METTGEQILQEFETETCSRCGGSGSYSYCQMYGTTCFKCGGHKRVFTKRGQAAFAWLKSQRMRKVSELKVGDAVRVDGYKRPLILQEIVASKSGQILPDKSIKYYTDLVFKPITIGTFPEASMEVIPQDEETRTAQRQAAYEYQSKLTKQGKERKR